MATCGGATAHSCRSVLSEAHHTDPVKLNRAVERFRVLLRAAGSPPRDGTDVLGAESPGPWLGSWRADWALARKVRRRLRDLPAVALQVLGERAWDDPVPARVTYFRANGLDELGCWRGVLVECLHLSQNNVHLLPIGSGQLDTGEAPDAWCRRHAAARLSAQTIRGRLVVTAPCSESYSFKDLEMATKELIELLAVPPPAP